MTPVTDINPSLFRTIRKHAGVMQKDAAAWMGVSGAALCKYEKTGAGVGEWRIFRAMDWMLGMGA